MLLRGYLNRFVKTLSLLIFFLTFWLFLPRSLEVQQLVTIATNWGVILPPASGDFRFQTIRLPPLASYTVAILSGAKSILNLSMKLRRFVTVLLSISSICGSAFFKSPDYCNSFRITTALAGH